MMHDELQQLIRLLVLHRYDIYTDRRKKRVIYTISALHRIQQRIDELQRATTATVAVAADHDTSNEQRKDVQP